VIARLAAVATLIVATAVSSYGCRRPADRALDIELTPAAVVVSGLSSGDVSAIRAVSASPEALEDLLRVRVRGADTHMAGRHVVHDDRLEFVPAFPFDPGRDYAVTFDASAVPGWTRGGALRRVLSLPRPDLAPVTRVVAVYPSGGTWPSNLLRAYVVFSGSMSGESGLPFVTLEDETGQTIPDVFLPIEADFWNADRTRYTVFFDPGRVKRGIRPNREQGRALLPGRRYALEVSAAWRDAAGRSLTSSYRHGFVAGAEVEAPLVVDAWRVQPPSARGRDPLAVVFPWAIDRGLADRSFIIVGPDGAGVTGESMMAAGEVEWRFTPREPWRPGEYRLIAEPILEDPAGNQIGRAFEVDMTRASPVVPNVRRTRTFRVGTP
jgi:hypothetical protein